MTPCPRCHGDGYYFIVPDGFNPFLAGGHQTARVARKVECWCSAASPTPGPILTEAAARAQADMWHVANARAIAAEGNVRELVGALHRLWFGAAVGTDAQRVEAMTAAGDLLARMGALDVEAASPADR